MKIFLSYASELGDRVAKVATQLRAKGYDVFHDEASLPPGESYHDRIKAGVGECDLFVYFLSPESVEEGRYTLTELGYAKQRWPNPSGKVLPVMARDTDLSGVDPYIAEALNIFKPKGSFAVEVSNAVEEMLPLSKPKRRRPWAKVFGGLLAVAVVVGGLMVLKNWDWTPSKLEPGSVVALRSWKDDYLHRPDTPEGQPLRAGKMSGSRWTVEDAGNGQIALRSWKDDYLHRKDGPAGQLVAYGTMSIGSRWTVEDAGNGQIALKSWKDDYLRRPDTPTRGQPLVASGMGPGSRWTIEPKQAP